MRRIYDILEEPRGDDYRMLLELCARHCASFLLVIREENWLDATAHGILKDLRQFELKKELVSEWPGTKLLADKASVYHYRLTTQSLQVLERSADGLYEWQQPKRPEDLCFFDKDGDEILVTIAHEDDAFLKLSPSEKEDMCSRIPNLKLKEKVNSQKS
jgi:hypothetical protein